MIGKLVDFEFFFFFFSHYFLVAVSALEWKTCKDFSYDQSMKFHFCGSLNLVLLVFSLCRKFSVLRYTNSSI